MQIISKKQELAAEKSLRAGSRHQSMSMASSSMYINTGVAGLVAPHSRNDENIMK
jgi:hypothetical protein